MLAKTKKLLISLCAVTSSACMLGFVSHVAKPTTVSATTDGQTTVLSNSAEAWDKLDINAGSDATKSDMAVDHVAWNGFNGNTYMMAQFTGKNAPTFVFRANNAYNFVDVTGAGYTNGSVSGWGGGVTVASSEISSDMDTRNKAVYFTAGLHTNASHTTLGALAGTSGTGLGMANYDDDTTYIMVAGVTGTGTAANSLTFRVNTFVVEGDSLTRGESLTWTYGNAHGATGSYAAIYPNIDSGSNIDPARISFSYEAPATSVNALVNNLSDTYAYKDDLQKLLLPGSTASIGTEVTWDAMDIYGGESNKAQSDDTVENAAWSGFSGDTYMAVQFTGKNVPNFVFRANNAYDFVDVTNVNYTNGSVSGWGGGVTIASTYIGDAANGTLRPRNGGVYYAAGLHSGASVALLGASTGAGLGMATLDVDTTYIMIVGVTGAGTAANSLTFHSKIFMVNADGSLTTGGNTSWTYGSAHGAVGSYAAIYPNILWGETENDPKQITFSYAQPATDINTLVSNLDDGYPYKVQLMKALGVPATVTVQDGKGETVDTANVVIGNEYVLPEHEEEGFIGWSYDGKLYAEGAAITVTGNMPVTARILDAEMEGTASIRVSATVDEYGGLRFPVKVKTSELAALGEDIKVYGQIMPTDEIEGTYDIGETGADSGELVNFVVEGEYTVYYITFTNVLYSNYNRQFSALAYAEVAVEGGETRTVIGEATRSVYNVAVAAYNDTEEYEKLDTAQQAVLDGYLKSTINLTYDEDGTTLKVATTEDGLPATFDRGYTLKAQDVGDTMVTLTIEIELEARLYQNNKDGLPHIPLTIWGSEGATRIVAPITQSYEGGVLKLVF